MAISNNRPKYNYKRPKNRSLPTSEHIDELVVQAALLLLTVAHKVPPDLYAIVEERNLGHTIIAKAQEQGNTVLLDDAIAQWG
jgi:hypothetical protein